MKDFDKFLDALNFDVISEEAKAMAKKVLDDQLSVANLVETVVAVNTHATLTLLRAYHEWLSQQQ